MQTQFSFPQGLGSLHFNVFERIFDCLEGLMITDIDGNIIRVNKSFSSITGYSPAEVLGKKPNILSSGQHTKEFYQHMWSELKETGKWTGEIWNRRKDGSIYPQWSFLSAVKNDDGHTINYVAMILDISAEKAQEEQLKEMSYKDPLTGLINRRKLIENLKLAHSSYVRAQTNFVVLFLDLNGFKKVNDEFGHNIGDEVLKTVANRLKDLTRGSDYVSRLGGDEFVVVLNNLPHNRVAAKRSAQLVSRKIELAIKKPMVIGTHNIEIGTSIGICVSCERATVDQILEKADAAMYQHKRKH
jgi:diguanylate cyclase (GGDEF)-like protein/PAS domain S-box-containing protein